MQLGKEFRGYKQQYLLQELKNKTILKRQLLKARADAFQKGQASLR